MRLTVSVLAALFSTQAAFAQEAELNGTLFTNTAVFVGVTPELIESPHVLVEGNLIAAVSMDPIDAPDATMIDGDGRTLTPDLIDPHTHLHIVAPAVDLEQMSGQEVGIRGAIAAEGMLMRGFTTVRDLCGNTHGMRRAINAKVIPGPRSVSAGACIGGLSSYADFLTPTSVKGQINMERIGMARIADGSTEVHLAIRETFERLAEIGAVVSAQVGVVPTLGDNPPFNTAETKRKACNLQEKGVASFGYINDLDIRTGNGVDSFGSLEGCRDNSQAIVVRKDFFSDEKILQQMFANNAELIAMAGERNPYKEGLLAAIQEGAYADILLFEGEPIADVAVFSDWENGIDLAMKDGIAYGNALN